MEGEATSMELGEGEECVQPAKGGQRLAADVEAVARAAGVRESIGPVQLLQFSDRLNSEDVKLLELSQEVLSALQEGQRVIIRGEPQEDAVLCTADTTFELRLADTSNSLLVCPSLSYPDSLERSGHSANSLVEQEVTACLFSTYELRRCRPRLEKLKLLLEETPFRGEEYERETEVAEEEERGEGEDSIMRLAARKYTFSQLLELVQASEDELREGLLKLEACNINGYWRLLDTDYKEQVFQYILTLLEEEDWHWSRVPLNQCCVKLAELAPRFAIEHCLCCYGNRVEEGEGKMVIYQLLEDRVCRFFAELLLRPAGRFNYHEFMESWQQSVPVGMMTALNQLKGYALTDLSSVPPVIWHYPVSELPQDPADRFNKLFQVHRKWTFEDLEPYISDLKTPTQSLNALLLKYTRASTGPGGVKVYDPKSTAL